MSIFIYLLLFGYLVIFAIVAVAVPAWNRMAPSDNAQLILGNYTNVLSALGASIAAGSGVAMHNKLKSLYERDKKLQDNVDQLHQKLDKLLRRNDIEADRPAEGSAG
ncbi:hypothetical protein FACS1894159_01580 [Bacteroidia bacterium]|nr:hypothetical protein FACS1894159_01580 [Bacteroidia bacterium]